MPRPGDSDAGRAAALGSDASAATKQRLATNIGSRVVRGNLLRVRVRRRVSHVSSRSPTVAEARREHGIAGRADIIVSKLEIRRRKDDNWTGTAWPALGRIVLSIPRELPDDIIARVRLRELALHEVVHVALPPRTGHGPEFRRVMLGAVRDWWPDVTLPAIPRMTCSDRNLVAALVEYEKRNHSREG